MTRPLPAQPPPTTYVRLDQIVLGWDARYPERVYRPRPHQIPDHGRVTVAPYEVEPTEMALTASLLTALLPSATIVVSLATGSLTVTSVALTAVDVTNEVTSAAVVTSLTPRSRN